MSNELLGLVGGVRFSPVLATAFVFGLLLLGAGAGAGRRRDLAQHRVGARAG
jgi:hypothetical protein